MINIHCSAIFSKDSLIGKTERFSEIKIIFQYVKYISLSRKYLNRHKNILFVVENVMKFPCLKISNSSASSHQRKY